MWEIREERPSDAAAIDALVERSFGPGRYAKSAYRLREGVDPEAGLSFVATEDGALRGSNRFWPVIVGDTRALLLGPLAVETERRGRGMGIQLMQKGIDEARARGHRVMILVGDLPYYQRVGFVAVKRGRITMPGCSMIIFPDCPPRASFPRSRLARWATAASRTATRRRLHC